MTKVIFKDKKSLQSAKSRTRGVVNYRQMKDGRVISAKWPQRSKKRRLKNK